MLKTLGKRHLRRCSPKNQEPKAALAAGTAIYDCIEAKELSKKKGRVEVEVGWIERQNSAAQLKHTLPPSHGKGLTQLAIDSNPKNEPL